MVRQLRVVALLVAALALAVVVAGVLPERAAAGPVAQANGYYSYSAKIVCGKQGIEDPAYAAVRPGFYATEVNIHNYNRVEVPVRKRVIPLVVNEKIIGREPDYGRVQATDGILLPPNTATMDDCARIAQLLGIAPTDHVIGFLEIISQRDLSIDAVYTVEGRDGGLDIDVERVEGKLVAQ